MVSHCDQEHVIRSDTHGRPLSIADTMSRWKRSVHTAIVTTSDLHVGRLATKWGLRMHIHAPRVVQERKVTHLQRICILDAAACIGHATGLGK